MGLTQIQKIQFNKQVDHILHVPGNQPVSVKGKSNQLEMAFVIDCSCDEEFLKTTISDCVTSLKQHDKIFQNVRCNVVYWKSGEEKIETEAMPMSFLQMGKAFTQANYAFVEKAPVFDDLCAYLKLFHARSKCIIVYTQGKYEIVDSKKVYESLNPFLKSKLLLVTPEKMFTGTMINMEMMHETC